MVDLTDDELLAELGVVLEAKPTQTYTPREERIIAGFEDIVRFYNEHGRAPQHGEQRDIFERLYAVRLDKLREQEDCRTLLADMDPIGLLDAGFDATGSAASDLDDDALLAELGLDAGVDDGNDITQLRHVQTRDERRAAEEIATRDRCLDFAKFKPLFDRVSEDLKDGTRETRQIRKDAGFLKTDIRLGEFFIVGGQTLYIAEVGDPIKAPNGENDARLRAIYSNGTQSNILLRSLQRAIYKDETSRRITEPLAGPLFAVHEESPPFIGQDEEEADISSGTIYVLRSKSNHPLVAQHRELIHKIGVTGGSVAARIAGAENDATYLLAGVDVVAEYKLFNINRVKLEQLIHRFFAEATLDIEILDRFGKPVRPKEWFLVPLHVIDEMVDRVRDGTIGELTYSAHYARITPRGLS
jgi:hypothetical protein